MSCINVKINRISNSPIFEVTRIGESIESTITPLINSLKVCIPQIEELHINIKSYINKIKTNFSIVCSINDTPYLKVSPEDIQWISPDYYVVYEVKSNTDWTIDY